MSEKTRRESVYYAQVAAQKPDPSDVFRGISDILSALSGIEDRLEQLEAKLEEP